MDVKKNVALREMFLRTILGTPSQPCALPFFSFSIMYLISLGDIIDRIATESKEAKENFGALASAFSDSVMRVDSSNFEARIARNLFLVVLVKFQNDPWPGFYLRSFLLKTMLSNLLRRSQARILKVSNSFLSCFITAVRPLAPPAILLDLI
jgi:hypothetical protein